MQPEFTKTFKKRLASVYLRHEDKAYILAKAEENDIPIIEVIASLVAFAEDAGDIINEAVEVITELDSIHGGGEYTQELHDRVKKLLKDFSEESK